MNHETHILEPIDGTTAHVIYREADDSALSKYYSYSGGESGKVSVSVTGYNYVPLGGMFNDYEWDSTRQYKTD